MVWRPEYFQAVKRNIDRFPNDFMFLLTDTEFANLKSQIVISSWGGSRTAKPYAFTEQEVAMFTPLNECIFNRGFERIEK